MMWLACACVFSWNGYPNNWGGGHPGDGKVYTATTYISSVSIAPFNEPNDIAYPMTIDQPDGCEIYVGQRKHVLCSITSVPHAQPYIMLLSLSIHVFCDGIVNLCFAHASLVYASCVS